MLVSCTTTAGLLCSGVVIDGTGVTGLRSVRCGGTGDAFTGVIGKTGTSAGASMLADLVGATFITALGASSFGVVPLKPGTLRGLGTTIGGGSVGARIGGLYDYTKLELIIPSSHVSLVELLVVMWTVPAYREYLLQGLSLRQPLSQVPSVNQ